MDEKYYVQLNGIWVCLTVSGRHQHFIDEAMGTEHIMTVDEYNAMREANE